MSEKCKFCGEALPENASFCHNCARSQLEKSPIKYRRRTKPFYVISPLIILVLLIAMLLLLRPGKGQESPATDSSAALAASSKSCEATDPEPHTGSEPEPTPNTDNEPKTTPDADEPEPTPDTDYAAPGPDLSRALYTSGDDEYVIAATFLGVPMSDEQSVYSFEHVIASGQRFYSSVQLYAFKNGKPASHEFSELVEDITFRSQGLSDSQPLELADCWEPDEHPGSLCCCGYFFSEKNAHTMFVWELEMKDGSKLEICQEIFVKVLSGAEYYFYDYPMNDIEELKALLESIKSLHGNTPVDIYLPPVTYEGELTIDNFCVNLYGSYNDLDGTQTCFTDTVTFLGEGTLSEITGIVFDTSAQAAGLVLHRPVIASNCTFRNCTTGVSALSRGWLIGFGCEFLGNDKGLVIDNSLGSQTTNTEYVDNTFADNVIAVEIAAVYTSLGFSFPGCIFKDNETNINNLCGAGIDFCDAVLN